MFRTPIRARLIQLWAELKLRLVDDAPAPQQQQLQQPSQPSLWDHRLTGDNWIGVFLIGLSLLTYAVALQHY